MNIGYIGPDGEIIKDEGGPITANSVVYDPSVSGLNATNAQGAIDELAERGSYMRFETYDDYEDAYENDEIPEGTLVIIDELNNDNITALQVSYGADSNVKAELDDINTALSNLVNKGSVSVTADGVKTYAEVLSELFGLADTTKINPNSYLEQDTGALVSKLGYYGKISTNYLFTTSFVASDGENVQQASLGSSSEFIIAHTNTKTDRSSVVVTSGVKYTLYY